MASINSQGWESAVRTELTLASGANHNVAANRHLLLTPVEANQQVTGFVPPTDTEIWIMMLANGGAQNFVLTNNTGSDAGHRTIMLSGFPSLTVAPGQSVDMVFIPGQGWYPVISPGVGSLGAGIYRVTGSNSTRTAQTLADITGLVAPLIANAVYEFEAVLSVASSGITGNQYGLACSAAGASVEALMTGTMLAGTQIAVRAGTLGVSVATFLTLAGDGVILIKGIVSTGVNAGNFSVQHAKVVSGTATCYINSFLKVERIA